VEALQLFAYRSEHVQFFRRREEWFEPHTVASLALWWTPEGEIPTVTEGKLRLEHLVANGPSAHAFTFKQRFPPPE
jgi:hypothetical protein